MLERLFLRLPPLWSVVVMFVGLTLPQALLGLAATVSLARRAGAFRGRSA